MKWIISGLILTIMSGCASSKKEAQQPQQRSLDAVYKNSPERYTRRTLAGKCRIAATVKEIDTTLSSENPEDICAKFPCRATISIDKVLGYGAGFNKKLAPGEELKVKFQFTLEPSNKILPGLQLDLPGLNKGMHFIADLEEAHSIGSPGDSYIIYRYEVKNKPE